MDVGIIVIAIACLLGSILLFMPLLNVWVLLLSSMLLSGYVVYFFPSYGRIIWLAPVLSLALFGRSSFEFLRRKIKSEGKPIFIFMMWSFLFCVLLSCTQNFSYFSEIAAVGKNIFPFWAIPFAFSVLPIKKKTVHALIIMTLAIAFVQVPVSVLQYILVDPSSQVAIGDSITGTFGGVRGAGGNSGAMTTFLVCVIMTLLSFWLSRMLKLRYVILAIALFLIPILLNETKVFFIYVPVGGLVLLWLFYRSRPIVSIIAVGLLALLIFSVVAAYFQYHQYIATEFERETKLTKYIDKIINSNISIENKRYGKKGQLTRLGAPIYWFQDHTRRNEFVYMLIGHGLGSSKTHSGIFGGHLIETSAYRGKNIGLTGLSKLLWDVGFFGTICFCLIFIMAYFDAGRIRKNTSVHKYYRSLMAGCQLSCVIFLMSLVYDVYLLRTPGLNSFSMFVLGLIVFCHLNKNELHEAT